MKDLEEFNMDITENKIDWKRHIHNNVKKNAFKNLINDNKEKSKTKHIYFTTLEIASYLVVSIRAHPLPKLHKV